ncbi:MAG TPA: ATP-binding protein [Terriglobales bacterium]|nr:ATP-binding protein [Terriglobales bacterium]
MRTRIFAKLMLVFLVVIAVTAFTLQWTVRMVWQTTLHQQIERDLRQKTLMFAYRVDNDRQHSLADITSQEGQAAGARATVVDPTGKVLADSEADPNTMENHASRKEFVAALSGSVGLEERNSRTLNIPFIYVAAPISGGAVRLAYPLPEIEITDRPLGKALLRGSLIAIVIAILIAAVTSHFVGRRLKRIVSFADRVAAGDLTARIASTSMDEVGQVAAALDRTARRVEESFVRVQTSQHELETLLNSMQDAVVAVGADGRVQWANRGITRLLHRSPRFDTPLTDSIRDPEFLTAVQNAAREQVVTSARSNTINPGRIYDVTAAPMPGGGVVAVLRDLTETERMEKTRRDFIANVSHELRTPLTSIQGYTETLLDNSDLDNHVRDFLEIIRKNAARMSRLTEDLLTLARVESGEQRFDIQKVSTDELLQDALESFREVARTYDVELVVENAAPDAHVSADREAIHQIFSNLIENALKYAASGKKVILGARPSSAVSLGSASGSGLAGHSVTVGSSASGQKSSASAHSETAVKEPSDSSSNGIGVEFYVRDFGPGISSEHVPRLFERFYRVDKARSRESGGTGLGLAIAKHIMFAHGGAIRAESELNHGSTFLFILPASQLTED